MRIFGLNIITDDKLSIILAKNDAPPAAIASYRERYERDQREIASLRAEVRGVREQLDSTVDKLSAKHNAEIRELSGRHTAIQSVYESTLKENGHLNERIVQLNKAVRTIRRLAVSTPP